MLGDDQNVFEEFQYNPFNVHQASDDEDAPMTKGKFKALNGKLDTLFESSKSSSSTKYSY